MPINRVDLQRGAMTPGYIASRIKAQAVSGFGIYLPLQERIKLVMNNIASNKEIYGIDDSVSKAGEGIDAFSKE